MLPIAKTITALATLAAISAPLAGQTPSIHGTPLPSGRIGIRFPTHASLVPGRPVDLQFEVTPLPPAPPSPPGSLRSAACSPAPVLLDQSGDAKMAVRGMSPGAPPVAMPGAGRVCPSTTP